MAIKINLLKYLARYKEQYVPKMTFHSLNCLSVYLVLVFDAIGLYTLIIRAYFRMFILL